MNLDNYLKTLGRGGAAKLAKAIDAAPPLVTRWRKGERKPSPLYAKRIEQVTLGQVTVKDLRPDFFE